MVDQAMEVLKKTPEGALVVDVEKLPGLKQWALKEIPSAQLSGEMMALVKFAHFLDRERGSQQAAVALLELAHDVLKERGLLAPT